MDKYSLFILFSIIKMWLFFFSNDLGTLLGQKLAVLVFSRNAAVGRSKAVVSRVNMYVLEHIVIIRVLSLIKVKIKKSFYY